jgi:hypothetical protein
MSNPIYSCCNENRRVAILSNPTLNGIDYLELAEDSLLPSTSPSQQTLLVHCLKQAPTGLTPANIRIDGGESVTGITAAWVLAASTAWPAPANTATKEELEYFNGLMNASQILVVRTSVAGDFSPYTLRLVHDASAAAQDTFAVTEVLSPFDPQLAEVTFSFKIDCPPYFDCKPASANCASAAPMPPPINYLAKDYGSFRSILLDRLNQLLPSWGASSEADMGIVLAELMAYVGDQLSYQQDAVATEAYLLTARSRISLRRHAMLVDYPVHDGCNARVWMQLQVNAPFTLTQSGTEFYTYAPSMPSSLAGAAIEQAALDAGVVVFEPMQQAQLFPEHNVMPFYTWGDTNCCLPQGATEATLAGSYPNLQVGDVLIFEEIMGPQTGVAADADLRHRYAVRLTAVTTTNALGEQLTDPLFDATTGASITLPPPAQNPTPVTEIQWSQDDALPAPLCLSSSFTNSQGGTTILSGVSMAMGNVVLADQGLSMSEVVLPVVPEPSLAVAGASANRCNATPPDYLPVRYRPLLPQSPITQAVSLPLAGSPVTSGAIALLPTGFVRIDDSNGATCLMVQPDDPSGWPQYFGVLATATGASPASFNLSVVYNPPGTPSGAWVVLEKFINLTLGAGGNAASQINGVSQFMTVAPASSSTPMLLPATPTMFETTGNTTLSDSANNAYLTVTLTNPLSWPPQFAVLAQGNLSTLSQFNLLLIYQPPDGAVGIQTPVVVEQFDNLTLATVSSTFSAQSTLLTVLTFEGEPNPGLSADDLMNYDASEAVPSITLNDGTSTWTAVPNLLASGAEDKNFVVEVEYNGNAYLRFGDDTNGMRPVANTAFTASYRIGNGTAGNVGAESLTFKTADPRIVSCTNPLPASGGIDPETMAQIRRRAPQAFLTQERAVTMTDYENVAEQNPQIEDAYANLRWTGSWYTVFVTAEPSNGGLLSKPLRRTLTQYVNRYRLAGQDIQLEGPDYVSLEIKLIVCVDPNYFQANVEKGLMQVLGSGTLPNGQPALFASGSFKLGQTVYLSPIYAAAHTVAGVESVTAHVFQPQGFKTKAFLHAGEISMGPFQVARMDNDPSLPANGQLTLVMKGGK